MIITDGYSQIKIWKIINKVKAPVFNINLNDEASGGWGGQRISCTTSRGETEKYGQIPAGVGAKNNFAGETTINLPDPSCMEEEAS